jgi:hypothetical protein
MKILVTSWCILPFQKAVDTRVGALGCFFPYGLFKGDMRVKKNTGMKKKHMAHLFLGIALLASSLTGYGMESNEVIGKQKGGATQATDKLEQGPCFQEGFQEVFEGLSEG